MGLRRRLRHPLRTKLANLGRIAGHGMEEDRYDEESSAEMPSYKGNTNVILPSDIMGIDYDPYDWLFFSKKN